MKQCVTFQMLRFSTLSTDDLSDYNYYLLFLLSGKVLALKSVGVSDWNGKSLNCTFGSSLEIDPMNIPGAKDLKDFYHSLSSRDQFQSLTSNDRSAIRPQSQQSDSFVTLKQIHDEFKDVSNSHTSSKYYNVCAYVTSKFGIAVKF